MILGVTASSIAKGIPNYDLANIVYDNKSINVNSIVADPYKISMEADKLLISSGGGYVYLMKNGNPSDLLSYTYNGTDGKATITTSANGAKFNWNELSIALLTSSEGVATITLPSAGDIVNSTSTSGFLVNGQTANSRDFQYSIDGSKFYLLDGSANIIYQYSTQSPFSQYGLTYDSVTLSVPGSSPRTITFTDDGKQLFVGYYSTNEIKKYNLSTPWDISSGTLHSTVSLAGTVDGVYGLEYINGKLFVLAVTTDTIYQYTLNT